MRAAFGHVAASVIYRINESAGTPWWKALRTILDDRNTPEYYDVFAAGNDCQANNLYSGKYPQLRAKFFRNDLQYLSSPAMTY